jgi:hypothetical protein
MGLALASPLGLERSDLGKTRPGYDPGKEQQWTLVEESLSQFLTQVSHVMDTKQHFHTPLVTHEHTVQFIVACESCILRSKRRLCRNTELESWRISGQTAARL